MPQLGNEVTDPKLLEQLNGPDTTEVTDQKLLDQLNAPTAVASTTKVNAPNRPALRESPKKQLPYGERIWDAFSQPGQLFNQGATQFLGSLPDIPGASPNNIGATRQPDAMLNAVAGISKMGNSFMRLPGAPLSAITEAEIPGLSSGVAKAASLPAVAAQYGIVAPAQSVGNALSKLLPEEARNLGYSQEQVNQSGINPALTETATGLAASMAPNLGVRGLSKVAELAGKATRATAGTTSNTGRPSFEQAAKEGYLEGEAKPFGTGIEKVIDKVGKIKNRIFGKNNKTPEASGERMGIVQSIVDKVPSWQTFKDAMRANFTPEEAVTDARLGLTTMIKKKDNDFTTAKAKLPNWKDEVIDMQPLMQYLFDPNNGLLKQFGIRINPKYNQPAAPIQTIPAPVAPVTPPEVPVVPKPTTPSIFESTATAPNVGIPQVTQPTPVLPKVVAKVAPKITLPKIKPKKEVNEPLLLFEAPPGKPDSPFRMNKSLQDDITRIVEDYLNNAQSTEINGQYIPKAKGVRGHLGTVTPEVLDAMKKAASSEYSSAPTPTRNPVDAFYKRLQMKTKEVLDTEVPGYKQMDDNWVKDTDILRQWVKDLTGNDKATVDASFKKLLSAMKDNAEIKGRLLEGLEEMSGKPLKAELAGLNLSKWAPGSKLFRGGWAAEMFVAIKVLANPWLTSLAATASPRLMGEFVYEMSKAAKQLQPLGKSMSTKEVPGQYGAQPTTVPRPAIPVYNNPPIGHEMQANGKTYVFIGPGNAEDPNSWREK